MYGVPEQIKEGINLSLSSEKIKQDKGIFRDVCTEIGVNIAYIMMMYWTSNERVNTKQHLQSWVVRRKKKRVDDQ